jgi:PKD repeat protein
MTLPRVLLGLAAVAAGFGAAFAIGSATAGSDRGEVGQPDAVQVFTDAAHVPTLERVGQLPPLRVRDKNPPHPGDPPPDGGDGGGTNPPPPPPNKRPKASFVAIPGEVYPDETVEFDAKDSDDRDGVIRSYEWDFEGDGIYDDQSGTTAKSSTSYPTPGTVTVVLQVTDDDKATNTFTGKVEVKKPPPKKE